MIVSKHLSSLSLLLISFFPLSVFAAPSTFKELVNLILDFLGVLTPVLFSFALLVFIWGVAEFILNAGNASVRESAKARMIWGVIGLFVLFSLLGIIRFLGDSLGISSFF